MKEEALFNQAKICLDQGDYEQAIALLDQCIENDAEEIKYCWYLGLAYSLNKQEEDARIVLLFTFSQITQDKIKQQKDDLIKFLEAYCLRSIEEGYLNHVRAILNTIFFLKEDYQNLDLDIAIDQTLNSLYQSGNQFAQNKQYQEAEDSFLKILELVDDPLTWYNIAVLYYESEQIRKSENAINNAIVLDPRNATYFYTLGLILEKEQKFQDAILNYQKTIDLDQFHTDAYNNLGNLYKNLDLENEALKIWEKALFFCPSHHGAYINLGNFYLHKRDYQKAELIYQLAIINKICRVEIYDGFTQALNELGKTKESIDLLDQAACLFPDNLLLMQRKELFLPPIYVVQKDICFYRKHFADGLEILRQAIDLSTQKGIRKAYEIINGQSKTGQTNFYLAYQGYNDIELQKKYGRLINDIMKAAYPQWSKPLTIRKSIDNRKLRIGYVSQRMQSLLARLLIGWIEHRNINKFEIYSYYLGETIDPSNQYFQLLSDHYFHFPNQLEEACTQIIDDRIDILVYFEIGMDPLISQLANLRLAPIQCATWGHPMTTGFPTIDYFLSSDSMEPKEAKSHYSEQLVRLPKLGFNIVLPPYLEKTKERDHFNIGEENIVYLSCQYLPKYLPQYDYIFPEIYQRVPHAKFVFIERTGSETITKVFKKRLDYIFSQYQLNYNDSCSFLPGLSSPDYFNLLHLSDVFLDTIGWSGGFTSLDAIACGLPIVTLPGELMRSRQSYGMLEIIEVTETIARDERQYIEIATKLGQSQKLRATIKQKILNHRDWLFNDKSCIVALEDFYENVIRLHSS